MGQFLSHTLDTREPLELATSGGGVSKAVLWLQTEYLPVSSPPDATETAGPAFQVIPL